MQKKKKFKMYVAAVKMAENISAGCGSVNRYDHTAKDLHEEGFLEEMEKCSEDFISKQVRDFGEDIFALATKYA